MLLYREILRLMVLGYGKFKIHLSTGHSRTSIAKVIKRVEDLQLSVEDLLSKTDAELHEIMFSDEILVSNKRMPDFDALRKELKRPGVTKMLLWQEYMRAT